MAKPFSIGENSRPGDMYVNPTRSKKLSAMRTQASDGDYRIATPPRLMTLESAIEFIAADELVEVTPTAIRLRKRGLTEADRKRLRVPTGLGEGSARPMDERAI